MAANYADLFARLGKLFNYAKTIRTHQLEMKNNYAEVVSAFTNDTFSTGTVAVSSGVVTLSGGTFPAWAARGVFKYDSKFYTVKIRTDNTHITLNDHPSSGQLTGVSAGESYELLGQSDSKLLKKLNTQLDERIKDSSRFLSVIKSDAENTLIEMVDDDLIESYGGGLEQKNLKSALRELIRQMNAASSTVDGGTITIAAPSAGGSNVGNGKLVLSALASQVYAPTVVDFPTVPTELIRATCVSDGYSNSIVENAEAFRIQGQRLEPRLNMDWPKGSGLDYYFDAANPDYEGGSAPGQNVLKNGNFEAFTANAPDFWTIVTGSAGTTVDDTTTKYTGATALEIDSDGSTAVKLTQQLGSLGGSRGSIKPDTPYTISFAVKTNGATMSAGVLRVYLTDGSAVLNNSDSNRKMQIEVAYNTVGALTTTYQLYTRACMTPASVAKGVFFVIETSTAFTAGHELYIDNVMLSEMHRPTAGGLACQVIPGSTRFATEDVFTSQVTNNREGEFQTEFDRMFDMESKGYALPSDYSGSNGSISDGLIG